ncbi:MAG: hypothetical protein EP305_03780 [Bacteroidetes bacterium]|nr:MAG: hypothetical protein EP305_03780 [Bacteroidota bacterium]
MSGKLILTLLSGSVLFVVFMILYLNFIDVNFKDGSNELAFFKLMPGIIGYSFLFSLVLKKHFKETKRKEVKVFVKKKGL